MSNAMTNTWQNVFDIFKISSKALLLSGFRGIFISAGIGQHVI